MADIHLRDVVKRFGNLEVVRRINLHIADGEFVALVGPSGCGKTTTLRMIAGLERISEGEIAIDGKVVNHVSPKDRDIAMVFQSYALYPHMSVFKNMAFGLSTRRISKAEIRRRVLDAARILDIEAVLDRRPGQLSGGQKQRVAMGRAIVRDPKVFLFDEPLSNLDAKLRVHMRTELKRLRSKLTTTTVYVTHDQVEAMTLADRIVLMNAGVIEQVGTPDDLYRRPRTRFVAGFIGSPAMNFIDCRLTRSDSGLVLKLGEDHAIEIPRDRQEIYQPFAERELVLGLRPEHITEPGEGAMGDVYDFHAILDVAEPLGPHTLVFFSMNDASVCGQVSPETKVKTGEPIPLRMHMRHMHLIDPENNLVIGSAPV